MTIERTIRWREHPAGRREDFVAAGHQQGDFFAHRAFFLPKAAPDGYKIAARSGLKPRPDQLWQVVVYALPDAMEGLPDELFFDDDIMWHRQHFGLVGQVATASMLVRGQTAYTAAHHSDLVQRISRRREHKTRVETRFRGWDRMLLNAILTFAVERGLRTVMVPTARTAIGHTDATRAVGEELFDRIYDRHVQRDLRVIQKDGWWKIDVALNRDRIVLGQLRAERMTSQKTICVCHDIERGGGHRTVDPRFAAEAEATSPESLRTMLEIEERFAVHATYNVLGNLLADVRRDLDESAHCLGFHSFDHPVEAPASRWRRALPLPPPKGHPSRYQLARCREVDYRIKGYRPAQSRLGIDATDARLAHFNFEWLASSARSFGFVEPRLEQGVVKLPIAFDDFRLHHGRSYDEWERNALAAARDRDLLVFSLHDCYAPTWLPRYEGLLQSLQELGDMRTLDQVAAEVTLASAA